MDLIIKVQREFFSVADSSPPAHSYYYVIGPAVVNNNGEDPNVGRIRAKAGPGQYVK
jgi:hypothetical protein